MRLGIGSYTYVWSVGVPGYPAPARPLTAFDLLRRASDLGVRVVQFADNLPLDRLAEADLNALLEQARGTGIALEVGTRGIDPGHLRRQVELAARVGSPVLRIVADTDEHQPTPDDVVAAFRAVLPACERAGVCLALENHDRFRSAVLAGMLERLNSPHAGLCLDTANSIGCVEHVDAVLAAVGRWVVNLHVKDYRVLRPAHQKGFVVEGRPAGQGQLDVPALLAAVRATGRDPNAILELWPPPGPSSEASVATEEAWARESVRYLRRFIAD